MFPKVSHVCKPLDNFPHSAIRIPQNTHALWLVRCGRYHEGNNNFSFLSVMAGHTGNASHEVRGTH